MNKNIRYIIIILVISLITLLLSFLIFSKGITDNLLGNLKKLTYINEDKRLASNYPVIKSVINSSDEKFVNTDVVITVNAKSNSKIKSIEYSYNLKKWKTLTKKYNSDMIKAKMIFKKDMNKKLYIRVVNEKGFKSYSYKTYVRIDKTKPKLKVTTNDDELKIVAKDNYLLEKLQYSNDEKEWIDEEVEGNVFKIVKDNFEYKYIRVVDHVGNISDVYEVK